MSVPNTPLLTVDALIVDAEGGVVLIRRGHEPFAGRWALPGGFVEVGETCENACCREAAEERQAGAQEQENRGAQASPESAAEIGGETVIHRPIFVLRV